VIESVLEYFAAQSLAVVVEDSVMEEPLNSWASALNSNNLAVVVMVYSEEMKSD
jgi:hypothetical protein